MSQAYYRAFAVRGLQFQAKKQRQRKYTGGQCLHFAVAIGKKNSNGERNQNPAREEERDIEDSVEHFRKVTRIWVALFKTQAAKPE
jgi:hypothetical protein